jgi:Predicted ATPase
MELIYLYIEDDGKNIKKCEFNFSPEYRFHYDKNKEYLHGERLDNYIVDFWNAPNVINISAIIGKNGSGKSNLLEYIVRFYSSSFGLNDQQRKNIIHIYKKNNKLYTNQPDINGDFELNECEYIQYPLNDSNGRITNRIIYYSPHYEKDILRNMGRGLKAEDISNGGFLREYGYDRKFRKSENQVDIFSDIERLMLDDTLKQLELFRFSKAEYFFDLNLPKKLIISFTLRANMIERDNLVYKELFNSKPLHELTFIEHIQNRLLNYIFQDETLLSKVNTDKSTSFEKLVAQTSAKRFYPVLLNMFEQGQIIFQNFPGQMEMENDSPLIFSIERDNLSFDFITGLYEYYFKEEVVFATPKALEIFPPRFYSDFIFYWQGVSAGELEYFNLLSRIYACLQDVIIDHGAKQKKQRKIDGIGNIMLLLDEPENSFHPEWQRLFLNNLIVFLKKALPSYKFQVILASHSPIFISDLPKDNIIFLDKEKSGNCKVIDSISQDNTFGANIHNLYRNSFFLNGLPMGEFAKEKINNLFSELNNGKVRASTLKEIQMIGEPLLKDQLMKLYNSLLPNDINDRIAQLESELKTLRQELHDKD